MRDIPVGNGSLLVNFDDKYQIRDIYFPHVGQENHTEGFPFRFGIWADGIFSWVYSDEWARELRYLPDTLVTDVVLVNRALGIEIKCNDTVAGRENIYIRRIVVSDLTAAFREIRVFLHQDFRIYENKIGDTAFYDPETVSLIHYKKHRYFLINTSPHFDEVATGRKAFRHSEGTWRDAEDGALHGGPTTEGSVDSTIGIHFSIAAGESFEFYYWIAAGTSHREVASLNERVKARNPEHYFRESQVYWREWLGESGLSTSALSPAVVDLYKRSLQIIRTQTDNGGAIIAATDHDVTERATDHYAYLWPRDGAFVANALDRAGYPHLTRSFFKLCSEIVDSRGYFLQKYNPDGSVGSGWHASWDQSRRIPVLPIQQDETALVLWALWEHYERNRDIEYIQPLYEKLVKPCADFLIEYRDIESGLPGPSWNLWEDRRGIHTFTCASVVAALRAAGKFAELFEDRRRSDDCFREAGKIVDAMLANLYDHETGRFVRGLLINGDALIPDTTVDASLFGIFYFGCFAANDHVVTSSMQAVIDRLTNHEAYGGIARFEGDSYMRGPDNSPPNSWIICTLWIAEYHIAAAKTIEDLAPALAILEWTANRALPSGVLAEQIDPLTGEARSVSPLTWSHSTFVAAVLSYAARLDELSSNIPDVQ